MAKVLSNFNITFTDFPLDDIDDWAAIIYFVGCGHSCPGCHNPELQSSKGFGLVFDEYDESNIETFVDKIDLFCKKNYTNKIVLSGGDPLFYIDFIKDLLVRLKRTNLQVCVYTGFTDEYCRANELSNFKYLKVGRYEKDSVKGKKLSSSNQKVLNENYEDVTDQWI